MIPGGPGRTARGPAGTAARTRACRSSSNGPTAESVKITSLQGGGEPVVGERVVGGILPGTREPGRTDVLGGTDIGVHR